MNIGALEAQLPDITQDDNNIWECGYSSSTDTEDDEDESDDDVADIIDEAIEIVSDIAGQPIKRYLLNKDDRYVYNYTYDKLDRRLLVIQDKKQWKNRSFACINKEREIRFDELLDEHLEKHPEQSDSTTSSDNEVECHKWIEKYYDDSYFVLSTGKYKGYQPGEQVFNCYGSRSNKFLLFNYGFQMKHNLYNNLTFRAWVDHEIQPEHRVSHIKGEAMNFEDVTQVMRWFKVIRLKEKFNFKLLEYIRSTLVDKYKGQNHHLLLISQPVDYDFEVLVLGCAVKLLESLLEKRFSNDTTKVEDALLKQEKLLFHRRQIYQFRRDQKVGLPVFYILYIAGHQSQYQHVTDID